MLALAVSAFAFYGAFSGGDIASTAYMRSQGACETGFLLAGEETFQNPGKLLIYHGGQTLVLGKVEKKLPRKWMRWTLRGVYAISYSYLTIHNVRVGNKTKELRRAQPSTRWTCH